MVSHFVRPPVLQSSNLAYNNQNAGSVHLHRKHGLLTHGHQPGDSADIHSEPRHTEIH